MVNKRPNIRQIVILLATWQIFSLFTFFAYAATDGTLGTSSTGSLSITITIPARVQITKLRDLQPPTFTGSGARSEGADLCIYTNSTAGRYRVTAVGSGSGGAFKIKNQTTLEELDYALNWNDQNGTSGGVPISSGTALTNQTGADTASTNCSGGTNSNLQVTFSEQNLLAAEAGTYSGSLSIMVEPD